MPEIVLIAHNIRSTHNVGAFFRTCDGFGISKIIFSGYTPYPTFENDTRLPYFADKLTRQIHKTALGAETTVPFECYEEPPIEELKKQGFAIVGLEQGEDATMLPDYRVPQKVALLLGNEIDGIYPEMRAQCDAIIEIPMHGHKESFNVSVATGIALYELTHPHQTS
jgi:tRNA G18 (ribose-2'-O)-methylase SpoU